MLVEKIYMWAKAATEKKVVCWCDVLCSAVTRCPVFGLASGKVEKAYSSNQLRRRTDHRRRGAGTLSSRTCTARLSSRSAEQITMMDNASLWYYDPLWVKPCFSCCSVLSFCLRIQDFVTYPARHESCPIMMAQQKFALVCRENDASFWERKWWQKVM